MANFKEKMEAKSWLTGRLSSLTDAAKEDKGLSKSDVYEVLSGLLSEHATTSTDTPEA